MADPQAVDPLVTQRTVSSFLSVPDDKKREVLGKLSPAAKQGLLTGITARKLSSTETNFEKQNKPEPYYGFVPSHLYHQAKEGVEQLASGTYGLAKDVLSDKPLSETYKENVTQPLEAEMKQAAQSWKAGNHTEAVGHYVASYLPFLGPWADQIGSQIGRGDIGGAGAKAGAQVAAGELAGMATRGAIDAASPREAMRYASGAGDSAASRAERAVGEKNAASQQEHASKVANVAEDNRRSLVSARAAHEQRVSDIDFENKRAKTAYDDTVKKVRTANAEAQRALQAGKDADVASQLVADQIAETLPKLHDAETAKASAMYPKVSGTADPGELRTTLSDVAAKTLQGTERLPSSLARVMDDLKEPEDPINSASVFRGAGQGGRASGTRGVPAQEGISTMEPKARARFLESLSPEERKMVEGGSTPQKQTPLTFEKLHGYYSELGRELYMRDLAGDEKRALTTARSAILKKMEDMTEAEGKTARFKAAQKNWAQLENTFRNTDPVASGGSPIARALRARDPIAGTLRPDYVRQILTDPKAYRVAKDMLSRYSASQDLQQSLDLMKQHHDLAKASPKTAKLKDTPAPPMEKPGPRAQAVTLTKPPEAPQPQTFDLEKWRKEQMEKYAIEGQKMRPRDFMPWRIPFTVAQQLISRMLSNPNFRKWVAQ